MELIIITAIIFFSVFLNSLNFIVGLLSTPKDLFFLGTVHWSGDYFYYLSQFAQGKISWLKGYDLYTADFPVETYVGWVNVFLGRIFYLLGVSHLLAYQLSVVIFSITFLGVSYLVIREIFSKRGKRIVAFLLFTISNAFPIITVQGGSFSFSYYDYWFNMGIPFNRLICVPHQLIARTCVVLAILLAIWWWKKRRKLILPGLLLVGFILASVEPVQWGLVVGVLFIASIIIIIYGSCHKSVPTFASKSPACGGVKASEASVGIPSFVSPAAKLNVFNIAGLFLLLGGLPMALYLKDIFSRPPYLQLALWEATQQVRINLATFILGNGPVLVLAIIGIFFFIRKITFARLVALIFSLVSVFLFFSPIPGMVKIINVRFLPAATTLFFACFAAEAIFALSQRFKKRSSLIIYTIVGLVVLIVLPAYISQSKTRLTVDITNAFYYVPIKTIEAYKKAEKVSTPSDTFLVTWPFNSSFPGMTGRRVFHGHNLLTIDYEKKDGQAIEFFAGRMKKEEQRNFLLQNKINYVLAYSWEGEVKSSANLIPVFDNSWLALYRVKRPEDR